MNKALPICPQLLADKALAHTIKQFPSLPPHPEKPILSILHALTLGFGSHDSVVTIKPWTSPALNAGVLKWGSCHRPITDLVHPHTPTAARVTKWSGNISGVSKQRTRAAFQHLTGVPRCHDRGAVLHYSVLSSSVYDKAESREWLKVCACRHSAYRWPSFSDGPIYTIITSLPIYTDDSLAWAKPPFTNHAKNHVPLLSELCLLGLMFECGIYGGLKGRIMSGGEANHAGLSCSNKTSNSRYDDYTWQLLRPLYSAVRRRPLEDVKSLL